MKGKIKDKFLEYARLLETEAIPQLSINCVIFGFHENRLHVIVNRITLDKTAILILPGGYIKQEEDLDDAVARVIRESTGLENIHTTQFAVFGAANRSFGKELNKFVKTTPGKTKTGWFNRRFITICYMALIDYMRTDLQPTQFMDAAQWLAVDSGKKLALDHRDILQRARETLIKELPYSPIASNLLQPKFTIPELQSLTEAILGRPIDRGNFRRKILKSAMLIKVGKDNSGKRRPADLYAFRHGRKTSIIDELKLGF